MREHVMIRPSWTCVDPSGRERRGVGNKKYFLSTRYHPLLKAFYQKFCAKGKPAKVALTAVMRKLLIHLNSLLRTPLEKLS